LALCHYPRIYYSPGLKPASGHCSKSFKQCKNLLIHENHSRPVMQTLGTVITFLNSTCLAFRKDALLIQLS
jgi:hypothetical protein